MNIGMLFVKLAKMHIFKIHDIKIDPWRFLLEVKV